MKFHWCYYFVGATFATVLIGSSIIFDLWGRDHLPAFLIKYDTNTKTEIRSRRRKLSTSEIPANVRKLDESSQGTGTTAHVESTMSSSSSSNRKKSSKNRARIQSNARFSLKEMSIHGDALSITSAIFNPLFVHASDWVENLFGNQSIHYRHDGSKPVIDFEPPEQDAATIVDQIMIDLYRSITKEHAVCSIEVLGYGLLEVSEPLMSEFRKQRPSFGLAQILVGGQFKGDNSFSCIYRGMYENWRIETTETYPNYWPMFFYCPISDYRFCSEMTTLVSTTKRSNQGSSKRNQPVIPLELQVTLGRTQWTTKFNLNLKQPRHALPKLLSAGATNSKPSKKSPSIAVCTTIPYTTSNQNKSLLNGAILREWIRYYLKLGIKVLIYDNDGSNRNAIFNDIDGPDMGRTSYLKSPHLVYHNYTIRSKLDPTVEASNHAYVYDNEEPDKNPEAYEAVLSMKKRYFRQGDDKMLTFTHCRFEAFAAYGIKHVLVADFDEFLACPTDPIAEYQSNFLHELIQNNLDERIDQITFAQKSLLNKTDDPFDCMISATRKHESPFQCFAERRFTSGGHSIKSLHITNACPLTGFHEACGGDKTRTAMTHNCKCNNKVLQGDDCSFLHIITKANNYRGSLYQELTADINFNEARGTTNEVISILASKDP